MRRGAGRAGPGSTDSRALLTMAHYPGTLAAARCLDAARVPVDVVVDRPLAPAAWSRAASRTIPGPRMKDPERFLTWLLSFAMREPGAVLHPTCDDLAWLIARHEAELAVHFRLYTAPYAALRRVLDKSQLYSAALAAGIEVPATWFPSTESEVERLAGEHELLVVKPRSQVFFASHLKGEVVRGPAHAVRAFRRHRDSPYAAGVRAESPDIRWPMLQEYVAESATCVYSITGFADRRGRVHGARGSKKVLQRPRLGVGLCFESAAVEPALLGKVERFCAEIGYFGVFEAEFIPDGPRRLLIDFNPRYYGQMGFDVARGVPLAWMIHLGATGREDAIAAAAAPYDSKPETAAYHDEIALRWLLALGRLAGGVDAAEARKWRHWVRAHEASATDAAIRGDDLLPAFAEATSTLVSALFHPRSSLRALRAKS